MMKKDEVLLAKISQVLDAEKEVMEDSGDRTSILATTIELESVDEPVKQVGRRGTFWTVSFIYSVDYLTGAKDEAGEELKPRQFHRSIRFDETGMITGMSDPEEITD